jgi:hypothetical protein
MVTYMLNILPSPTLRFNGQDVTDHVEKAQVFKDALFPPPPPPQARHSDMHDYIYPQPIQAPPITETEVAQAVNWTTPRKDPGSNSIPNLVLHRIIKLPDIFTYLTHVFDACLVQGYPPNCRAMGGTVRITVRPYKIQPDSPPPKAPQRPEARQFHGGDRNARTGCVDQANKGPPLPRR